MGTRDEPAPRGEYASGILGWLLPDGGELAGVSQQRIQRFCWYELPTKWMVEPAERWRIIETLAGLLEQAGRHRVARVITSPRSAAVTTAWTAGSGREAYLEADVASGIHPAESALLEWSVFMGVTEAAAHDGVSKALEAEIEAGCYTPGSSGNKQQVQIAEAWLTATNSDFGGRTPLEAVLAERRQAWTRVGSGAAREARAKLLTPLLGDLLDPPKLPEDQPEALIWLMEQIGDGVTLTQAGYLPRTVVDASVERFPAWRMIGAPPRTEVDVFHLSDVRDQLAAMRLVFRRARKLALTKNGRAALDHRAELHDAVVRHWFNGHRFATEVAEATAARLLTGPATEADILAAIAPLIADRFGIKGHGRVANQDIREHAEYQLLRPGMHLGFVARDYDGETTAARYSLTTTGHAAALTGLKILAEAPRRELG